MYFVLCVHFVLLLVSLLRQFMEIVHMYVSSAVDNFVLIHAICHMYTVN